jgi:glucuronoarabinoxylan endo-1,4-beta-xylanase
MPLRPHFFRAGMPGMPRVLGLAAGVALLLAASTAGAQTATVDWATVHQVIDGFGGADAFVGPLTSAQLTFFFGTDPGDIGLTLLRTDIPDDGSCTTVSATCAGYVSDLQAAVAKGAKVWGAPWSPPASMKTNGSTICNTGSGDGSLSPASYGAYATYLSHYIASLKSLYNIQLYALSVQNEPDYCPTTYDGAIWSGSNFDDFIKNNLGPTLASAGQSSTLIIMPEASQYANLASEATTTMSDSAAAAFVGINAWHDYDHAASVTNPFAAQGKKYWETEVSAGPGFGPSLCTQPCFDPSMADALMWAQIVDNRLVEANVNAWHYWWLAADTSDNESLIANGVTAKRAYMLGNYSLFVRPGYYRIDATHAPQNGVTVSAYQNLPGGDLVIVATNQNSATAQQTFEIENAPAFEGVTPWITDATRNLIAQTSVSVSSNSFSYTLAADSLTTFVASAGPPSSDGGPILDGAADAGSDAAPNEDGGAGGIDATPPSDNTDAGMTLGGGGSHGGCGTPRRRCERRDRAPWSHRGGHWRGPPTAAQGVARESVAQVHFLAHVGQRSWLDCVPFRFGSALPFDNGEEPSLVGRFPSWVGQPPLRR